MKIYLLERSIDLRAPLEDVFPFFAKPENLERITPDSMRMDCLTPSPIPMHAGSAIDYVIKLNGIRLRWTTLIADYDPPYRFVDVQLKGPYAFWHHTHTFEEILGGTRVRDEVRYAMPFGILGTIVHGLKVKRDLEGIFSFRTEFLARQFGVLDTDSLSNQMSTGSGEAILGERSESRSG